MKDLQTIWPKLQEAGVCWVPGMLALDEGGWGDSRDKQPRDAPRRISWLSDAAPGIVGGVCDGDSRIRPGNDALRAVCVPDITDTPTVYALLGELRRVTGDRGLAVHCGAAGRTWWVTGFESRYLEGAAVIAALCSVLGVEG